MLPHQFQHKDILYKPCPIGVHFQFIYMFGSLFDTCSYAFYTLLPSQRPQVSCTYQSSQKPVTGFLIQIIHALV